MSLAIGLAAVVIFGMLTALQGKELSNNLLRLHVIANSDDAADQQLKLKVRDSVLEVADVLLQGKNDSKSAAAALKLSISALEEAAENTVRSEGYDYSVRAEVVEDYFPTKEYDGFALPAGVYNALRITIGNGGGQNWWCVVFPPLCTSAATDFKSVAKSAGLSDKDIMLITEESGGYELRFQLLEFFASLSKLFRISN